MFSRDSPKSSGVRQRTGSPFATGLLSAAHPWEAIVAANKSSAAIFLEQDLVAARILPAQASMAFHPLGLVVSAEYSLKVALGLRA